MLTAMWQRLDRDPPVFFEDQLAPALGAARERVFALGLLRPTAPSGFAPCRECGTGYVGRVEWLTSARTGARDAYIPCPACGPVRIDPDALRQWRIDLGAVLGAVRAAGRIHGPVTEVVPGHAWHLGSANWARRRREAYFVRCVYDGTRARIAAALATHPRAVLLFPTEGAAHAWGRATENPVVALNSVAALGPEGITFDTERVEGHVVDSAAEPVRKKAPPKRASRVEKISRLTAEVIEFLRRARSHAFATLRLSKEPALLPRPTKAQLGRSVELSKPEVTRCFNDPDARELNLYWDMAADLDAVMAFQGPISAGPSE
ncbi:hypothetical protein J8F10_06055 [Gemmata sp. G18]|uniref:Uncharacterized protein n=1 Tax=Gemmata palustris TaxID=2822762 RepID=A0ABS5BND9_9BACT|nr:hypothetical protein [Gemmata palustris]MBP3954845.1 hypothetical protein [Gemmata palustris]